MKKQWLFIIIAEILLLIYGSTEIAKELYSCKIYQKYSTQYSWLDKEIYNIVLTESAKYKIDKKIIFAIIHSESNGSRYAVSSSGALGLMQVMPFHVSERKEVLFDTTKNIKTGVAVLSDCLKRNNGNLIKALNAYERGNKRQDVNVKYLAEIIENIYFTEK